MWSSRSLSIAAPAQAFLPAVNVASISLFYSSVGFRKEKRVHCSGVGGGREDEEERHCRPAASRSSRIPPLRVLGTRVSFPAGAMGDSAVLSAGRSNIWGERLEWNDACSLLIDTCTVVRVTSPEGEDIVACFSIKSWREDSCLQRDALRSPALPCSPN